MSFATSAIPSSNLASWKFAFPITYHLEVTRRIRETFSKDEMPVIMVTTQNENQDNEAAIAAGVNEILHKPFTKEGIGEVLARCLG